MKDTRVRGNTQTPLNNYKPCPYCRAILGSEGWLKWHIRKYHPEVISHAAPPRDYGLPYWVCDKCGYRVGPALLSYRYQPCQKWQDMMETGRKCDGGLSCEEKEEIIFSGDRRMDKIEYRFEKRPAGVLLEEKLAEWGNEGWELVCVLPGRTLMPTEMILKRRSNETTEG